MIDVYPNVWALRRGKGKGGRGRLNQLINTTMTKLFVEAHNAWHGFGRKEKKCFD